MRLTLLGVLVAVGSMAMGQDGDGIRQGGKINLNHEKLVARPYFTTAGVGGRPSQIKPFQPTVFLGKRDPQVQAEFELREPYGTYEKPLCEVFSDVSYNVKTSAITPTNRVLVQPVEVKDGKISFVVNFAQLFRRTGGKSFHQDLMDRLSQQGHLTLYVCLERQKGPSSPFVKVEIGEPEPIAFNTSLEVCTVDTSGSVPGKINTPTTTWGVTGSLDSNTQLRWKTEAVGAWSYVVQLNKSGFSDNWKDWALFGAGQQVQNKPKSKTDQISFYASDLFFVMPKPLITKQEYYARVVPLDRYGNLAGLPSNSIKMSVPLYDFGGSKGKPSQPSKPKSQVYLKLCRIDYYPENRVIDDTRFMIVQDVPQNSPYYSIYKALAGQEPKKGVKLQIVPQSDDQSWYEAVGNAIGSVISDAVSYAIEVSKFVDHVVDVVSTVLSIIPNLGVSLVNSGVKSAMQHCGIPDSYIDKYEMVRNSPGYVAGFTSQAESKAENMTVGQARNRFFQIATSLGQHSGDFTGTPQVSPFLGQDPDYQYRPPRMFLRIRAQASDSASAGQFSDETSINATCLNFWEDASYQLSNGQPLTGQMPVIDSTVLVPAIPDGAEITMPIYLQYSGPQYTGNANWGRAWFNPNKSQWMVWGRSLDGLSTKQWSRTY